MSRRSARRRAAEAGVRRRVGLVDETRIVTCGVAAGKKPTKLEKYAFVPSSARYVPFFCTFSAVPVLPATLIPFIWSSPNAPYAVPCLEQVTPSIIVVIVRRGRRRDDRVRRPTAACR